MTQFLTTALLFMIDVFTILLIGGVFYVIGLAVVTMARNRQPRWDSIMYILLILVIAIGLLQWYPQMVITSIRESLESSRPEAALLRAEIQEWLPRIEPLPTESIRIVATSNPVATPTPEPEATPKPEATSKPTATPLPPTPTPVPTLDLSIWNVQTPPPTPEGS